LAEGGRDDFAYLVPGEIPRGREVIHKQYNIKRVASEAIRDKIKGVNPSDEVSKRVLYPLEISEKMCALCTPLGVPDYVATILSD